MSEKKETRGDQLIHSFSSSRSSYIAGLSKREYFAGLAMQGLLASGLNGSRRSVIIKSINHADELIAELNKEE